MESRMDKYYREDDPRMKRSSKNARLYQEVYNNYDNLDNLPIPDNTNEIDRVELERMVKGDSEESKIRREDKYIYQEEQIKNDKQAPGNKIHDINMLLENAKKENEKLKENDTFDSEISTNYKLLSTLENKILTKDDIELHQNKYNNNCQEVEQSELKYQTKRISVDPNINQIITHDTTSSLSLDILSDLKPNDDNVDSSENDLIKPSAIPDDTDIVNNDSTFYTDTYSFSNKDFDDDFELDGQNEHFVLKIIFLILIILVCMAIIFYFISNYGINQ